MSKLKQNFRKERDCSQVFSHSAGRIVQPTEEWWVSVDPVQCSHVITTLVWGPGRKTHHHILPETACFSESYWSDRPSCFCHTSILCLRLVDEKHWHPISSFNPLISLWICPWRHNAQVASVCPRRRSSSLWPLEGWHQVSPKSAAFSAHQSSLDLQ